MLCVLVGVGLRLWFAVSGVLKGVSCVVVGWCVVDILLVVSGLVKHC